MEEAKQAGHVEYIFGDHDDKDFEKQPGQSRTGVDAQLVRGETILEAENVTGEKTIGDERHRGDVQIGQIGLIARSHTFR